MYFLNYFPDLCKLRTIILVMEPKTFTKYVFRLSFGLKMSASVQCFAVSIW